MSNVNVSVSLPLDVIAAVERIVTEHGVKRSEVLSTLLREALKLPYPKKETAVDTEKSVVAWRQKLAGKQK